MKLAFYLVNNSCEYTPETFSNLYDKPEEIRNLFGKLKCDEWRVYDLSTTSPLSRIPNAADFMNDYNGEELDGGWWCLLLKD